MGFGSGEFTPGPGEIDGDLTVTGNISGSSYTMGAQSGSIAGDGSYLGVNASGLVVLTSSIGASIANDADNRITTAVGDGTLNAEQNFTFDGATVQLTGTMELTGSSAQLLVIHARDADGTREIVFKKDGADAAAVVINNLEHLFLQSEQSKDIIFRTAGENPIRIFGSNQRVAIGNKASANAPLDVDGNTIITGTLSMTDDISLLNDKKVNFGTAADSQIEYNSGISKLAISGSSGGIEFQGGGISIDFPGGTVASGTLAGDGSYLGLDSSNNIVLTSSAGGGGGGTPAGVDTQIQFNDGGAAFGASAGLTWDDTNLAATRAIFGTTAATLTVAAGELSTLSAMDSGSNKYTTQYDAVGKLQGHVLSLGGSATVANKLYFLSGSGGFLAAQANDSDTGGNQLLGIALGADSTTNGILRRGTVRVTGSVVDDEMEIGAPVYVSKTTAGNYQFATPSGSGEYVRQVGYCLDISGADVDMLLLFEPSDTFIEIA